MGGWRTLIAQLFAFTLKKLKSVSAALSTLCAVAAAAAPAPAD